LQWNEPDRHDWYAMQVAAVVQRFLEAFMKDPKPVKMDDFKIPFEVKLEEDAGPARAMTKEEYCHEAQAIWRGMLGIPDPAGPAE
jgi:hypothetical protein